jgi:hypothetical protein
LEVDEKGCRNIIISIGIFAIILIFTGSIVSYYIGRADTGDSTGVEFDPGRERELLERIGEYELRERDRIAAENCRIGRERERIERTKEQLGTVRELDRRSGDLLQELEREVNILADYFRGSCDLINNGLDNTGSE